MPSLLRLKEMPQRYPLVSVTVLEIVCAGFKIIESAGCERDDCVSEVECLSFTGRGIQ